MPRARRASEASRAGSRHPNCPRDFPLATVHYRFFAVLPLCVLCNYKNGAHEPKESSFSLLPSSLTDILIGARSKVSPSAARHSCCWRDCCRRCAPNADSVFSGTGSECPNNSDSCLLANKTSTNKLQSFPLEQDTHFKQKIEKLKYKIHLSAVCWRCHYR